MARIDNLNNFLTDVAESIRAKKGTTDLISPSNFDTEIESIQTGADLSEYFAENIDKGKSTSIGGWMLAIKKMPPLEFNGTSCLYMFARFMGSSVDFSKFDTSKVTTMENMFYYAGDSSNPLILDFRGLNFSSLTSLRSLLGSASVKSVNFENCDFSNVDNVGEMFGCNAGLLTDIVFGKNLGAGYSTSQSANYSSYTLNLSKLTKLTEASLISVLNGLADIASLGVQTQTCQLGSTNLAKLTSEAGQQALAQAQAYGWTVS